MIEKLLASRFKTTVHDIENCFTNCRELVEFHLQNECILTKRDKILITNLVYNVRDDTVYDYPLQKLQIYTLIVFSNFLTESVYLYLDEEYTNTLITVIFNTDIIQRLFKLL